MSVERPREQDKGKLTAAQLYVQGWQDALASMTVLAQAATVIKEQSEDNRWKRAVATMKISFQLTSIAQLRGKGEASYRLWRKRLAEK